MLSTRLGAREIVVMHKDRIDVAPGQTIRVVPHPGRMHFFDAANGGVVA
jgi:hypothetical protein